MWRHVSISLATFAPNVSAKAHHEQNAVADVTFSSFETDNRAVKRDPREGRYSRCDSLVFYSVSYLHEVAFAPLCYGVTFPRMSTQPCCVSSPRRATQFVDRCPTGPHRPTGFKIGICKGPPSHAPDRDLARVTQSTYVPSNMAATSSASRRTLRTLPLLKRTTRLGSMHPNLFARARRLGPAGADALDALSTVRHTIGVLFIWCVTVVPFLFTFFPSPPPSTRYYVDLVSKFGVRR
jgi:hypothetical protein